MNVGAVNGGVAAGSPAGPEAQKRGMVLAADENVPARARSLHLGVATKAKIRIRDGEELPIDRPVGIVARSATVAHRRVFVNDWFCLLLMALAAGFVSSGK